MIKLMSLLTEQQIYKILQESSDYDADADFFERCDRAAEQILSAFKSSKSGERFHWPTVSASRLQKIWLEMGKTGVVRDDKGMWNIREQFLNNIAMLHTSTELMGHSSHSPNDTIERAGFDPLTPEEDERLGDFLTHSDGSWLLSDYGLPKLERLYNDL